LSGIEPSKAGGHDHLNDFFIGMKLTHLQKLNDWVACPRKQGVQNSDGW
jgi:hypothetical protein